MKRARSARLFDRKRYIPDLSVIQCDRCHGEGWVQSGAGPNCAKCSGAGYIRTETKEVA